MSDIVVGSVAVDIVPSTRNLRRDIEAKVQGISVDVGVNADTTGVRAQIESASRSRPALIRVKVDDAEAKTQLAGLQNSLKDKTLALDLSTTQAKAKVADIQAQIAVVKGQVDLDPKEAQAKVSALQAQVKQLRGQIELDTAPARAEIGRLRADIAAAKVSIKAQADTAEAEAQLDATARDRTSRIRANVDESQVSAVQKIQGSLSGISAFSTGLITLGPALIPILAALAGVGLALGAPLAIAGGGATVFGFLAGFAVKQTNQQLKDIEDTRKKLGTLTKGTAEYAAQQALLKEKIQSLSPAQKKFSDALDHIKGVFAGLIGGKVGDQLLGPISSFLNLTADVLPRLEPVIGAVSDALSGLLGDLGKAVKGPDFKAFIDTFSKQVGPDITAFGHIAGNVFKGVAGLVTSLGDAFGPGLLKGLENLTGKFADFGQQAGNSKKLQDFVAYFKRVGPEVGDTIGAVARAVGHVVTALAPLGPPALKVIEGIANAISGIPVPVLTAMAGAFSALVLASKVSKGVGSISSLLGGGGLTGGLTGRGATPGTPLYVWSVNGGGTPGGGGKNLLGLGVIGAAVGLAATTGFAHGDAENRAFAEKYGQRAGETMAHALARSLLRDRDAAFVKKFGGSTTLPSDDVLKALDLTRAQARNLLNIPELKSTTDKFDALKAHAADASRTIDLIGPHAKTSFSEASSEVKEFAAKWDAIHDKRLRVILDDLAAVQSLRALQALRLKDKTLTIHVEQEMDRVVGPGGGQGRPLGGSAGGAGRTADNFKPAPTSGAGNGGSGSGTSPIHVDKMFVSDTNDALRKSDARLRNRAGGGVALPPPLVASFGG